MMGIQDVSPASSLGCSSMHDFLESLDMALNSFYGFKDRLGVFWYKPKDHLLLKYGRTEYTKTLDMEP